MVAAGGAAYNGRAAFDALRDPDAPHRAPLGREALPSRRLMFLIRPMQPEDAAAVARLHARSISQGFLSRLGRRFLRQLYLGIARAEGCRVLVAVASDGIGGFCAYAHDVSAMYRRVLRARAGRLALASLPRSLNPRLVREVLDTLRYPAKQSARRLPPAEILSIAVADTCRGAGVGKQLLEAALELARQQGQPAVKVLAGARLEGAHRFYRACGFEPAGQIVQHGEALNVYVRRLGQGGSGRWRDAGAGRPR